MRTAQHSATAHKPEHEPAALNVFRCPSAQSYYSSDDERKVEKRQKFEQHRRQHYQMREAKEALRR